jgi:mannose-6-phosphate isomerase class I
MEILLVTEGGAVLNNNMTLKKGEAVCLLPGATYSLISSGHCTIFKAFV